MLEGDERAVWVTPVCKELPIPPVLVSHCLESMAKKVRVLNYTGVKPKGEQYVTPMLS